MYNITNEDILKLDEFMKSEDIEKSSIQSGRDENGNVGFVGYQFKHTERKSKNTGMIFIDITKDLEGRFEMSAKFICGFDAVLSIGSCGFNFDSSHFNSMLFRIIRPMEQLIRFGLYGCAKDE